MTRKPQINDPEAHVVVSHGADFFGGDSTLREIAYAQSLGTFVCYTHGAT